MSGIVLQRVGGLSPVRQTNKSAPEKYGVWAFVWPYLERFLLGSTGAEGVHPKKGRRYDQLKRVFQKRVRFNDVGSEVC